MPGQAPAPLPLGGRPRRAALILRRGLDGLYLAGGIVAALFLVAILVLIVAQMLARWTGGVFPGATDYAGYCMAGASFMAFAHALNEGAHIRVELLLGALGTRRRWGEIWCVLAGALITTYMTRYAISMTYWTWKLGDVSQGQDATPLWIPQVAMALGAALLALCFWDNLIRIVVTGRTGIRSDRADQAHAE